MAFKHTGLFPEQAVNWNFIMEQVRGAGRPVNVLNLFAYTGGATLAAAAAGAIGLPRRRIQGMTQWAREDARFVRSGGSSDPLVVDDCKSSFSAKSDADASMTRSSWTRRAMAAARRRDLEDRGGRRGLCRADHAASVRPSALRAHFNYSTGLAPSVMAYAGHDRRCPSSRTGRSAGDRPAGHLDRPCPACGSSARYIAAR